MKKLLFPALVATFAVSCTSEPCNDIDCQNGGVCDSGQCLCPDQYEGPECSELWRTKFLGTYTGAGTCNGQPQNNETMSLTPGQTIGRVNFDNGFFATVSGQNTLTIPLQTYFDTQNQTNAQVSGSVSYNPTNNSAFVSLSITINGNSASCTYTLLKE